MKTSYEKQLREMNRESKRKSEFERNNNHRILTANNEKNNAVLEDTRARAKANKQNYIEKTTRERNREMLELRQDFNNKMGMLYDSFENRFKQLNNDSEVKTNRFERRINKLQNNGKKQTELNNIIHQETMDAERNAFNDDMRSMASRFRTELVQARNDANQKLEKTQRKHAQEMQKITDQYESQLSRMRLETTKEDRRKTQEFEARIKRMQERHQIQMITMENQFKVKLQKLEDSYKDMIDKKKREENGLYV